MKKFISYFVSFLMLVVLVIPFDVFAASNARNGAIQFSCMDNTDELPTSEEYNPNAPWSMSFFPHKEKKDNDDEIRGEIDPLIDPLFIREQFLDLNGDGLIDYFFVEKIDYTEENRNLRRTKECVYLNNGQGWTPVYRCFSVENYRTDENSFTGDCALIEE